MLAELLVLLVIAGVTAAVVRAFLVQPFYVPSGSMRPAIEKGEHIVVSKVGAVQRGDVVVFENPGSWLSADHQPVTRDGVVSDALEFVGLLPPGDQSYLVKRLVGLPGDHVICCDPDGRVTVNGVPLEESYLLEGEKVPAREFDVVVPRGSAWVLGDHRANSSDSRAHLRDGTAFVPLDDVVGRAVAAIWPLTDIHRLGGEEVFDAVPEPEGPAPKNPVVSDVARDPGLDG